MATSDWIDATMQLVPSSARQALLELLDELTRPMTAREIENALKVTGLSASQRKVVVAALKPWSVVAIHAGADAGSPTR